VCQRSHRRTALKVEPYYGWTMSCNVRAVARQQQATNATSSRSIQIRIHAHPAGPACVLFNSFTMRRLRRHFRRTARRARRRVHNRRIVANIIYNTWGGGGGWLSWGIAAVTVQHLLYLRPVQWASEWVTCVYGRSCHLNGELTLCHSLTWQRHSVDTQSRTAAA